MKNKYHIGHLFSVSLYVVWSTLYFYLLLSGSFKQYVHPKFMIFSWIIPLFFAVLSILSALDFFLSKPVKNKLSLIAFSLIALLFTVSLYQKQTQRILALPELPDEAPARIINGYWNLMDGKDYFEAYTEVYWNGNTNRIGSKIRAKGIFYQDPEIFDTNQAAVARMTVVCCAPHAQPFGFICSFHGPLPKLGKKDWIEVQGNLVMGLSGTNLMPLIDVEKWHKIKTEDPLVFP